MEPSKQSFVFWAERFAIGGVLFFYACIRVIGFAFQPFRGYTEVISDFQYRRVARI